jgi:hypothetical protein
MDGGAGDEQVAAVDAVVDEELVGGQRFAELGVDERDRGKTSLGGVLAGDIGRDRAGGDEQVDRAEGAVDRQGEAVVAATPRPATGTPELTCHAGQGSPLSRLSSSD